MRYGNAHNVHDKNKKSDFTRAPKNPMELMGSPFADQTGEKRPILEEGYSYEGGEDMVAVGEVGVSKRYGGGRDGMHHKMESRTVYKKAPEPEKAKETKAAPEPEKAKGPEEPEPPVSYSEKLVNAKERVNHYENQLLDGEMNPYGKQSFAKTKDPDAQSFLDEYKLNLNSKYEQNDDGNYVDKDKNEKYKSAMEKYEEEKRRFDEEQAALDQGM